MAAENHLSVAHICISELAIVMAAICLLSGEDGLLITMALFSSEQVSQSNSSLLPCRATCFCWVNELSQQSEEAQREHKVSSGNAQPGGEKVRQNLLVLAAGAIRSPHPRVQTQQNDDCLGFEVAIMPLHG